MWREGYRHLRCLMPAQGWYEWQERGDLTPTRKGRAPKQPYYIHCDQSPVIAQAEVAERVGTTQCAIARLESAAPKHSPSIATVRRYARALGNRLEVRLVKHQQADAPQRRRAQVNGVPISQLAAPARPTPSGDAVCDRQPSRRR
jgi:transcriptional regulator with XRE-family HTH domain